MRYRHSLHRELHPFALDQLKARDMQQTFKDKIISCSNHCEIFTADH